MDYISLLEEAVPSSQTNVFYHVTFSSRVPVIQKNGILVGRKRNWNNTFGAKLGKTSLVYLFSDEKSAVRWAARMEWEFKKSISILVINDPPGNLVQDESVDLAINGYHGITTDESIPSECIIRVVPLTQELKRALTSSAPLNI